MKERRHYYGPTEDDTQHPLIELKKFLATVQATITRTPRKWVSPHPARRRSSYIPFRKNWLPSLSKNLLPEAVMVAMALAVAMPAAMCARVECLILSIGRESGRKAIQAEILRVVYRKAR